MAYGDDGAPNTWKRWIYQYGQDLVRRFWGVRLFVGTVGALKDRVQQAIMDAVIGSYHRTGLGPAFDAPRLLGNERSMPQYPTESWPNYVNRLATDWETWGKATAEQTIIDQLGLAGAPGAQIFRFSENDSWSEFVVFYPAGSHSVTGTYPYGDPAAPAEDYGSAGDYGDGGSYGPVMSGSYGDGRNYGPIGISPEQLRGLKDLIIHWKGAEWKCPYLIWETSGETYGTGHTYNETDLVYGGAQVRTKVQ